SKGGHRNLLVGNMGMGQIHEPMNVDRLLSHSLGQLTVGLGTKARNESLERIDRMLEGLGEIHDAAHRAGRKTTSSIVVIREAESGAFLALKNLGSRRFAWWSCDEAFS